MLETTSVRNGGSLNLFTGNLQNMQHVWYNLECLGNLSLVLNLHMREMQKAQEIGFFFKKIQMTAAAEGGFAVA